MSDRSRPAWAHDSLAVRLAKPAPVRDFTPEVAFAGSTGAGVRVAVIDSGIDSDHPMLGSCVDRDAAVEFTVSPDGEVIKNDGPHDDAFGHGTAVAGIIHALAPEASITSVRVLGPNLTGKAARSTPAWCGRSTRGTTSSTCRSARLGASGPLRSTRCATAPISATRSS
ncbi:MAG: S8 family serine peptidase [Acidimicrobiales bacterium]